MPRPKGSKNKSKVEETPVLQGLAPMTDEIVESREKELLISSIDNLLLNPTDRKVLLNIVDYASHEVSEIDSAECLNGWVLNYLKSGNIYSFWFTGEVNSNIVIPAGSSGNMLKLLDVIDLPILELYQGLPMMFNANHFNPNTSSQMLLFKLDETGLYVCRPGSSTSEPEIGSILAYQFILVLG